ncbi:Hypothetical predicted protein, partial [Olea europaea subsp. europaea]
MESQFADNNKFVAISLQIVNRSRHHVTYLSKIQMEYNTVITANKSKFQMQMENRSEHYVTDIEKESQYADDSKCVTNSNAIKITVIIHISQRAITS